MAQRERSGSPMLQTRTPAAVSVSFDRLPQPDYDRHPAYGRAFEKPTLALRLRAVATLAPWLAMVLVKRVLLFDRLPSLPDYGGPMGDGILGRLSVLPRYVPLVSRALADHWRRRLVGGRQDVAQGNAVLLLERLRERGIALTRFSAGNMASLNGSLERPLTSLLKRRETRGNTTFEGNQAWLNTRNFSSVYAFLDHVLDDLGIIGAASAYLQRPVKVTHLTLQINDTRDAFHHNKFSDAGCPDPPTNYMHVDTSYEVLKCMIYLNEVNELNGPFCYVPGTSRLRGGFIDGLVRRAMDRSGLTGYARPTRQAFMALPRALRRKSTFGSDLMNGTPEVDALIAAEYRATSADGDVVLFDNLGVHRGALVKKGERRILVATLG